MTKVLLVTPPFTQLNTPYPATAYLKGFLNTKNIDSYQMDLGIEVINALFSQQGLRNVFTFLENHDQAAGFRESRLYQLRNDYVQVIEPLVMFLQGNNPSLARQICSRNFLPEGSRFDQLDDLDWAFGNMGMQDKAKHLATMCLEDISDFLVEYVDPNFGFSRYAERLGMSANSFNELSDSLDEKPTYIDLIAWDILSAVIKKHHPELICFSVPFPGNLYSAFRNAQFIKSNDPNIKVAMGGGFANTELRSVTDCRVFDYFDFITLDDGELPIELLVNYVCEDAQSEFKRTFLLQDGRVVYQNNSNRKDYKQSEVGTPDYSDLKLDQYISVIEIANPMHSLWSDGRWNKLTMAHGCYWGKCTFCDISLDYIKLYEPISAKILVDRMEELILQTNESGFHFVDEAAPPALMRELAMEIIRRKLVVTWWTNIRFEKSFSADLCKLLAASGCVAVSGGLEVASDRLLKLIDKGVSIEQVTQVTRNLTEAGVMTHAYLMYGYPSQTIQETIDSLEVVRQLFELGIVQSGFWHQFALTTHSPVGRNPETFGVIPQLKEITFANNDVQFDDTTGIDHGQFSFGLKKSLYNYMHAQCFDFPLQEWFNFDIPETTLAADYLEQMLVEFEHAILTPGKNAKVIYLGNVPCVKLKAKSKQGARWEMLEMEFQNRQSSIHISLEREKGEWLLDKLDKLSIYNSRYTTYGQLKIDFESRFENFELFWFSKAMQKLRSTDLLVL